MWWTGRVLKSFWGEPRHHRCGGRLRTREGGRFPFSIIFQLRRSENRKNAANPAFFELDCKLPKLRTWVRFPSPAPETEDKQVTLRLTPIQHLTPIQPPTVRFFRLDLELHGASSQWSVYRYRGYLKVLSLLHIPLQCLRANPIGFSLVRRGQA